MGGRLWRRLGGGVFIVDDRAIHIPINRIYTTLTVLAFGTTLTIVSTSLQPYAKVMLTKWRRKVGPFVPPIDSILD